MKMKLQLVRDGEIIFGIPLSPMDWSRERLENEFKTIEEEDFQRFSKIFDALAHETRLRMMKRLVEEEDRTISFSDFMRDLDLNPKLVWENARKLKEGGLLEKIGRGRYRCSEFGESGFMMIGFALRRLKKVLEEMEEF
jgi:DNA-binding transcriptional ArsR family regulator